jgi:phosphatidyl-myo-inositol dimannoside synthase
MRCLIITPYYPPAFGGACRMLGGIAEHLQERGHTVDVLTFGTNSTEEVAYDRAAQPKIFRVSAQEQNLKSIAAMGRKLLVLCSKTKYDAMFCGTAYSSAALAYLVTRVRRTPYVVYTHGEDVTIVGSSRWKKAWLLRAMRASGHTFTNSRFTANALGDIVGRGGPASLPEVEVLHPSIDPTEYLASTDDRAARWLRAQGLENRRSNLLITVARLQERKGHDTVVQALPEIARHIPDVHYLIVGKGDPTKLNDLAAKHGVADRVTIIHSLNDEELADAYRASTLHVMVSRFDGSKEVEGFGMVYLEAAAAGRTSVAGNQGGASEAVVDGLTGLLVDPTSVEQTETAIVELLTNHDRRLAMESAAKRRTVEDFNDDAFFRRILEVCETVPQKR